MVINEGFIVLGAVLLATTLGFVVLVAWGGAWAIKGVLASFGRRVPWPLAFLMSLVGVVASCSMPFAMSGSGNAVLGLVAGGIMVGFVVLVAWAVKAVCSRLR